MSGLRHPRSPGSRLRPRLKPRPRSGSRERGRGLSRTPRKSNRYRRMFLCRRWKFLPPLGKGIYWYLALSFCWNGDSCLGATLGRKPFSGQGESPVVKRGSFNNTENKKSPVRHEGPVSRISCPWPPEGQSCHFRGYVPYAVSRDCAGK